MEPSGERCEVPVIPKKEIPKQSNADKSRADSGTADDVADIEKNVEHQYVLTSKKIDGTKAEHEGLDGDGTLEGLNSDGKPKAGGEVATTKAT